MVKVSVIIPVYNTEKYLRECLTSLENQTLKDIEIICVDDGSTDDSLDILKEYNERDPRFTILQQKNKYAGIARNNGLDHASGECCIFLDSDDFFEKDLLEKAYNKLKSDNAEICLFSGNQYDTGNNVFRKIDWLLKTERMPEKTPFSAEENKEHIFDMVSQCPWTKMYSLDFVKNAGLRFQGTRNSNDVKFVLTSLAIAKRITFLNEVLVHYRIGMDSNIQANKHRSPFDFYEAYNAVKNELEKRGLFETFKKSYLNITVSGCLHNIKSAKNENIRTQILYRLDEILTELRIDNFTEEDFYNTDAYIELSEFVAEAKKIKTLKDSIKTYSKITEYPEVPDVTVIIPINSWGDDPEACLNAVRAQNYANIEIICINDGYSGNSLDILEKNAAEDKRISIISGEYNDISDAVNEGIKNARGKYIYYIRSDEILKQDAIEKLYKRADRSNLDILFFDGDLKYNSSGYKGLYPANENYYKAKRNYKDLYTGRKLYAKMVNDGEYGISSCIKFVRTEFLRDKNIAFYEGNSYEDNIYTFSCMMKAERTGYLNDTLFQKEIKDVPNTATYAAYREFYGYFISLLYMTRERDNYIDDENLSGKIDTRISATYQNAYEKYLMLSDKEKKYLPDDDYRAVMIHKILFLIPSDKNNKYIKAKENEIAARYSSDGRKDELSTAPGNLGKVYEKLKNTESELESIHNSLSFKLGRLLTWLPRKLRGVVLCFKEHGVKYTVKRTLQHLTGKTI